MDPQTDAASGGVKMDVFEDGLEATATKGGPVFIDLASDPEPGVNEFRNANTTMLRYPRAPRATTDTKLTMSSPEELRDEGGPGKRRGLPAFRDTAPSCRDLRSSRY